MKPKWKKPSPERKAQIIAELRRERIEREKSYRAQALKLFPHICARCGREFDGKRLKELTVHHIDHDHDNNPPDGSNWELLCVYCHDNEHEKTLGNRAPGITPGRDEPPPPFFKPFEDLDSLIKT